MMPTLTAATHSRSGEPGSGLASTPRGRVGGARQHAVLGRDPALALPLEEARHLLLDGGRADDLGVAELHEHRPLGVAQVVAREGDPAELIRATAVMPRGALGHRVVLCARAGAAWAVRMRWSQRRL